MNALLNRTASFLVPMAVLMFAMWVQKVSFESTAAFAIVAAFMTLKVVVQHFKFEPGRAIFAGVGKEKQFLLYVCGVYCAMALATVQLFVMATH